MLKGYLSSTEGVFPLAPRVTGVGRAENSDLVVQSPSVEQRHAVIEYSETENCFILQDLNTAHGTYVNDCRVQNAAVRLAPGDVIRFGYAGLPHRLEVEEMPQVTYPPVQPQRPGWQGLTMLDDSRGPRDQQGLPSLPPSQFQLSLTDQGSLAWVSPPQLTSGPAPVGVMPHPPMSFKVRPSSAGNKRATSLGNSPVGSPKPIPRSMSGGWMNSIGQASPTTELQEKEQKLLRMADEINRLAVFEAESQRKDKVIATLRSDVEKLQMGFQHHRDEVDRKVTGQIVMQQVGSLEKEIEQKKLEINALKEQMSRMRPESQNPEDSPAHFRSRMKEAERELITSRQESNKLKKDRNTNVQLVQGLQREVSAKEKNISRLTAEVDRLKKEVREKDVSMAAMSAKFSRVKENKKLEEDMQGKDKDIISLKHKLKGVENKLGDKTAELVTFKDEIEKLKLQIAQGKEEEAKLLSEVNHGKTEFLDMQRTERLTRSDLDQAQKRYERFRSRVVQQTYSAPGIKSPDDTDSCSDDQVIDAIKNLIDDRNEVRNKVRELRESVKSLENAKKEAKNSSRTLKQHLESTESRIQESGYSTQMLNQEVKLLQSITVEESLQWIKKTVLALINRQVDWQQEIGAALEKCGFNASSSDQVPAKYIENLQVRIETAMKEKDHLKSMMLTIEQEHEAEVNIRIDQIKQEHQTQVKDALETARIESDQRLEAALREVREAEDGKRAETVEVESKKVKELEDKMAELRQALTDKGDDEKKHMSAVSSVEEQLEESKRTEAKLQEELSAQGDAHQAEIRAAQDEAALNRQNFQTELASYKEQIKQHSLTIVAMEERILSLSKQNKQMEDAEKELQSKIDDLEQARTQTPPQPAPVEHVILESAGRVGELEQLVTALRREAVDYQQEMQDQQDVVLALRRDLAGASARLSDLTGELSEQQKEEIERNRSRIKEQESELVTSRQQLAQLSELVDKQVAEIKQLKNELGTRKQQLGQWEQDLKSKSNQVVQLQNQLTSEQETQRQVITKREKETVIANELSSVGAQCRGERHQQVIERQREALAELRYRIKGNEIGGKMQLPNHDQAIQQVILLKKELAELRAQQAALMGDTQGSSEAILDAEVAKARGQLTGSASEAAMERSARSEMSLALEDSETSYLDLAKSIGRQLELKEMAGLQTLGHLPRDEREAMRRSRDKSLELITSRIKVLQQRLERKDELLQDYEKDLARLRRAEEIANEKAHQVESLSGDVRGRVEENQYLRESLQQTRETLERERRLNTAIKSKKTFHLENDDKNVPVWPRHSCYKDDIKEKAKVDAKRKSQKERFSRKSYEIEVLKDELKTKDQQLCDTTAKLIHLEDSMGTQE